MTRPRSEYRKPQLYKDAKNQWRWRLRTRNGRTGAESGEGYYNRAECLEGLAWATNSRVDTDDNGEFVLVTPSLTASIEFVTR